MDSERCEKYLRSTLFCCHLQIDKKMNNVKEDPRKKN